MLLTFSILHRAVLIPPMSLKTSSESSVRSSWLVDCYLNSPVSTSIVHNVATGLMENFLVDGAFLNLSCASADNIKFWNENYVLITKILYIFRFELELRKPRPALTALRPLPVKCMFYLLCSSWNIELIIYNKKNFN